MRTMFFVLALLVLVATAATADPIALLYAADAKSFKSVTASDMLDFQVYDDAGCTNLVSTTSVSAADPSLTFAKTKGVRVKKGPKPAKSVQVSAVVDPGTFPGTPYLAVTISGATPLVGVPTSCQVQAGQTAGAPPARCSLGEAVVGSDATGAPICRQLGPVGPLVNVEPEELVGWEECYRHTYAADPQDSVTGTILVACDRANLLLGCREVGTTTLDVAAFAARGDVVPATGELPGTTDNANGTEWYYDDTDGEGWGFARGGSVVNNSTCDVASADPERRLCVHVFDGAIASYGGFRCGTATGLIDDTWEWLVYHKD